MDFTTLDVTADVVYIVVPGLMGPSKVFLISEAHSDQMQRLYVRDA